MKKNEQSLEKTNILLLQGPMGFFFKRLDHYLRERGAKTFRIGLNASDHFFSYHDNYTPFKGSVEQWKGFFENFIIEHEISMLFLFGDCRLYQSQAIEVATEHNLQIFVFEEGYVRPDYITMERFGVNDYSLVPREREFYELLSLIELPKPITKPAHHSTIQMVLSAMSYYLIANIFSFRYPHYQHHREFSALQEAFYGLRSIVRKRQYKRSEALYDQQYFVKRSQQYFFIPLQTYNDFQLKKHSNFPSIEAFIKEVLLSFTTHCEQTVELVIKHHPVDRGRKDYTALIEQECKQLGIEKRVLVIHDVHLPTVLKNAKGTITINSTVGFSSLLHGTPTLALGRALYDIDGLTANEYTLEEFWEEQPEVDMLLFEKYRRYIIHNTQLNGSFYGELPNFINLINKFQ